MARILKSLHGRLIGLTKENDLALQNVTTGAVEVVERAPGNKLLSVTGALTVTADGHAGKVLVLNAADGQAITLPAATGTGNVYRFIVGTTITSNTSTIKVVGDDIMAGLAVLAADGGSTSNAWETAADSDTITMDGSTRGGIKGDEIVLTDMAADTWHVRMIGAATGVEATPFSATV